MFIAPRTRGALGDIASSVFARRFSGYRGLRALGRRDAQRWFERVTGPDGPWYTDPIDTLPDS